MKLTALPVNVGDSFLLRDEDKIILVDGGKNKKHILQLLYKEQIPNNHIDLLVCTHYDADHINGIVGILQSNKFTFKELWLPEILGSIGYSLSTDIHKLFKDPRSNRVDIKSIDLQCESIFKTKENGEIYHDFKENNSFEAIDTNVLDDFIEYSRFWHYEDSDFSYKMMLTLKSIALLISNALHSGAYIRWFKYSGYTHKSYGFDLYSENAIQTDITLYDSKLFFLALYHLSLSDINKYSLVYMYHKENVPNVLFSADSDFLFYSQQVALKNSSIVTAPHHGSSANDSAYQKILGTNLIFVRSDSSQLKRPGKGYLQQTYRFCTICRNKTVKQKVELNYNGSAFTTTAKACIC